MGTQVGWDLDLWDPELSGCLMGNCPLSFISRSAHIPCRFLQAPHMLVVKPRGTHNMRNIWSSWGKMLYIVLKHSCVQEQSSSVKVSREDRRQGTGGIWSSFFMLASTLTETTFLLTLLAHIDHKDEERWRVELVINKVHSHGLFYFSLK